MLEDIKIGVYTITNIINTRFYLGSSADGIDDRWKILLFKWRG